MKILLSHNLEGIGGGSSFARTLIKGLQDYDDIEITYDENDDYDVLFILTATSMKNKSLPDQAKEKGKRIVLRIDNMPKQSRNREDVYNRLKHYAELADEVVYQSEAMKTYIAWGDFPRKGKVILNGVDSSIFNRYGGRHDFNENGKYGRVFLYTQSSTDPCKRAHEAFYVFEQQHRKWIEKKLPAQPRLIIVGRGFDQKLKDNNFDFVRGEAVKFMDQVENPDEMAKIYRACDELLFPSFNDACPNTILEARACGIEHIQSHPVGGSIECQSLSGYKLGADRMALKYVEVLKGVKQW